MQKEAESLFDKDADFISRIKNTLSLFEKERIDFTINTKVVLFFIIYSRNSIEFWHYMKKKFNSEEAKLAIIYSTLIYLGFEAEPDYLLSVGGCIKC